MSSKFTATCDCLDLILRSSFIADNSFIALNSFIAFTSIQSYISDQQEVGHMGPIAEALITKAKPAEAEVALPTEADSKLAAEASRALSKSRPTNGLRVRLDDNTELMIPQAATRLILHILTEMASGNAVTIMPIHAELTTQEAADFLNVSRPYLIKLLNEKKISHHKVGTHRRIRFLDLINFKKQFEAAREKSLDELVRIGQEMGLGY